MATPLSNAPRQGAYMTVTGEVPSPRQPRRDPGQRRAHHVRRRRLRRLWPPVRRLRRPAQGGRHALRLHLPRCLWDAAAHGRALLGRRPTAPRPARASTPALTAPTWQTARPPPPAAPVLAARCPRTATRHVCDPCGVLRRARDRNTPRSAPHRWQASPRRTRAGRAPSAASAGTCPPTPTASSAATAPTPSSTTSRPTTAGQRNAAAVASLAPPYGLHAAC